MANQESLFKRYGVRYPGGTIIFKEGDKGNKCFIILSGRVELYKKMETVISDADTVAERDIPLNIIGKGDIFGEMAMLEGKPRSASARALTDTEMLALDKDAFLNLIQTQPQISFSLLKTMSERLRVTSEKIKHMVMHFEELNKTLTTTSSALSNLQEAESQLKEKVKKQKEELEKQVIAIKRTRKQGR